MYTGITQGLFLVTDIKREPNLLTYCVEFNEPLLKDLTLGASISVNGVCQTVMNIAGNKVYFNAIAETLNKTTLSGLTVGQKVSIERSAKADTEIGGHRMYGHIYGTAEIIARHSSENNLKLTLQCPPEMMDYIFEKGFIGVDGSSLTVSEVNLMDRSFAINLIPHTLELTNFNYKIVGDKVNIELDANTLTIVETIKRLVSNKQLNLAAN